MTDQATRDLAAIRRGLRFDQWDKIGWVIAQSRRQPFQGDSSWVSLLPELREKSLVALPEALEWAKVQEMSLWFATQPTHMGAHSYTGGANFSGYRPDSVLRCPGLVDTFNDPRILGLVEAYLGCVPTLYSVNAWWSHVGTEPQGEHLQHLHRDTDDFRFVTLFLYLTDVDEESGAFQIHCCSHLGDVPGEFKTVTGAAGTMFLANTIALHRGLVPTKAPRLMCWARYGLGKNSNSNDLEGGPIARQLVPTTLAGNARDRYVNRLLFDWGVGPI